MYEPDDDGEYAKSLLRSAVKWARKASREILVCLAIATLAILPFVGNKSFGIQIATALIASPWVGIPLWLLYKFARFTIGI